MACWRWTRGILWWRNWRGDILCIYATDDRRRGSGGGREVEEGHSLIQNECPGGGREIHKSLPRSIPGSYLGSSPNRDWVQHSCLVRNEALYAHWPMVSMLNDQRWVREYPNHSVTCIGWHYPCEAPGWYCLESHAIMSTRLIFLAWINPCDGECLSNKTSLQSLPWWWCGPAWRCQPRRRDWGNTADSWQGASCKTNDKMDHAVCMARLEPTLSTAEVGPAKRVLAHCRRVSSMLDLHIRFQNFRHDSESPSPRYGYRRGRTVCDVPIKSLEMWRNCPSCRISKLCFIQRPVRLMPWLLCGSWSLNVQPQTCVMKNPSEQLRCHDSFSR